MEMDATNPGQVELTRTGRRGGCSCCSFTLAGLMCIPAIALALFFVVL